MVRETSSRGPQRLESLSKRVLGQALAMLRIARGMSQKEAARLVGTSSGRLSHWENGDGATFTSVHNLLQGLDFSWSALERALRLVRQQSAAGDQAPQALQPALPPDLAELAERIGKTVAHWYLQVVQRELALGLDRPHRPARMKPRGRRGGIRHPAPSRSTRRRHPNAAFTNGGMMSEPPTHRPPGDPPNEPGSADAPDAPSPEILLESPMTPPPAGLGP
jgi:transcriptional regulator with XRE-family HTH domain